YKVILPNKYENSDYNYMIALLLIDKEVFQNYEELALVEDKMFNLRYTYGRLTLKNGKTICILNLYIPQSYQVSEERKLEIKKFWKNILEEVRRCRIINEEFIVIGDLNAFDDEASENKDSLIRLNDIMIDAFEGLIEEKPEWRDTWISPDGKTKRRLDYIFVNSKVLFNNSISCNVDSSSLELGISDHKILELDLKLLS
ncbi:MAG: endonuclease/exonuclease/phosphatase family protein, partial [Carnobacterium jeotgali]|uniref:endonuclease/exonuclease/phosphatase family protein n=1 Tax=Carnobacterium jeotgali TaxID=545534 RepID=UPI003C72ED2E